MTDSKLEFKNLELKPVAKGAALAGERLKLGKQIVTEGGFTNTSVAPVLVVAVYRPSR